MADVITMQPVRVEDIPPSNGLQPRVYEPLVASFVLSGAEAVELFLGDRTAKGVAGSLYKAAKKHNVTALVRKGRVFLVRNNGSRPA